MNWTPEIVKVLLSCGDEDGKPDQMRLEAFRLRYCPELNPDSVRRAYHKHYKPSSRQVDDEKLAKLIRKALVKEGVNEDEVREISQIDIKHWQMGSKDADGNPQVTDLEGTRIKLELSPSWAAGPQWDIISQAKPTIVNPAKQPKKHGDRKVAVIAPDPQIGFRRDLMTGELDPFHDEAAMELFLQACRELNPDVIVNLGDLLDLPEWGTYEQEATFAMTTQATLDRAHLFLAQQRAAAPNAKIVVLEGNHDRRLIKAILRNAIAAFGLKRANEVPESFPVLSVPFLLRMDELDVEYIVGYPANAYYINDRVKCIHGLKVRSGSSTARAVSQDERVSTIFGHIHRAETHYKTVDVRGEARINFAHSPGCLCRIDGAVPSVKGSTDLMGRPIVSHENWQQGFSVVTYVDGDGDFSLEHVFIHDEGKLKVCTLRGTSFAVPSSAK
jgi:predicted phosphodiesterase